MKPGGYIPVRAARPAVKPPPPEPSRREHTIKNLKRLIARAKSPLLIGAGMAIVFIAVLLYNAITPEPYQLTEKDIETAVEEIMGSLPPPPSYASVAYETIRPSLVRVEAFTADEEGEPEGALGTGVVIIDDGTILTSLHVVRGAPVVRVIFADGSESTADLVSTQPENDLAVLRAHIIPDDLIPATMASASRLRVGDEIVAVGNPFGIHNSVSAGVVSGLRRSYVSEEDGMTLHGLIQFDAVVNPGNSGGPLLNRNGEVVGIVAALLNPTGHDVFIGIGFAVTIDTAEGAAGPPPY